MKNIMVTGGFGFVGQHLIHTLLQQDKDYKITILDRVRGDFFIPQLRGSSHINIIDDAELTDISTLEGRFEGLDAVYHTAAAVSFWRKHKKNLFNTNITGTENVIKMCLKHRVKRLIYVSSTAALGNNNDKDNPVNETYRHDWRQTRGFYYMLSKYQAEQKIKQACLEGLPAVIANPSSMYGPGDRKIFALVENLLSGQIPAALPGGLAITDVRDTARALAAMLERGGIGENYLIIGGNYTYREMLDTFAEVLNVPSPARTIPGWLKPVLVPTVTLAEIISPRQPKLLREVLAPGFGYRYYNCTKAQKELGWAPEIPLKQSCRDIFDFYKSCFPDGGL